MLKMEGLVAHYTSRETGIEGVLNSGCLKFSSRIDVNDPRESKLRGSHMGWCGHEGEHYATPILSELTRAVDSCLQICCFSESSENRYTSIVGQSFCLPNMWAYYGANHTGMCFLFDKQKLIDTINQNILLEASSMNYADSMESDYIFTQFGSLAVIDEKYHGDIKEFIRDHCKQNGIPLIFQKDDCWRSEQELRVLIYGEGEDSNSFIEYGDALVGIILGLDFNMVYLPLIRSMIPSGVELAGLEWDGATFDYRLAQIK